MKVTFSRKADAVYFAIADNLEHEKVVTESLDPRGHMVNVDFTESGRILGIEVLEAESSFAKEFLDSAEQIDLI
jgi:uncharacterized protein YuzE